MNKQGLKRLFLLGIPLILLLGYLVFVFIQVNKEEKESRAEGIKVVMTNPQFNFVDREEILKIATKQFGDIKNLKHDSIDRNKLEIAIKKNPFVEDAQVFRTASNSYCVEITQRTPFIRVWTDENSYYLDKDGCRMPTGRKYPVEFQKYLENNPFWEEIVDYVVVNSKEELTLYLSIKSGKIYFGKIEKIAEKLEKLKLFINKLGKFNGMDTYESIDLRFDNQVVVKKKKDAK